MPAGKVTESLNASPFSQRTNTGPTPDRRREHGRWLRCIPLVGRRCNHEWLGPVEHGSGLCITDTAGWLAIDAALLKGFAEVNRDFSCDIFCGVCHVAQ